MKNDKWKMENWKDLGSSILPLPSVDLGQFAESIAKLLP